MSKAIHGNYGIHKYVPEFLALFWRETLITFPWRVTGFHYFAPNEWNNEEREGVWPRYYLMISTLIFSLIALELSSLGKSAAMSGEHSGSPSCRELWAISHWGLQPTAMQGCYWGSKFSSPSPANGWTQSQVTSGLLWETMSQEHQATLFPDFTMEAAKFGVKFVTQQLINNVTIFKMRNFWIELLLIFRSF